MGSCCSKKVKSSNIIEKSKHEEKHKITENEKNKEEIKYIEEIDEIEEIKEIEKDEKKEKILEIKEEQKMGIEKEKETLKITLNNNLPAPKKWEENKIWSFGYHKVFLGYLNAYFDHCPIKVSPNII
jgi:hypothetical protein